MRSGFARVLLGAAMWMPAAGAQTAAKPAPAPLPSLSRAPQPTVPVYIDPAALDAATVVLPPPAKGSATEAGELAAVHAAMEHATAKETAAAQADGKQEDMFIFTSVLGPEFEGKKLPLTKELGEHLINDARMVNLSLKRRYARVRPFIADSTLHPTCGLLREPSYPSGHAMDGYLTAFALMQIVPERAEQILARADEYAQHRIVCGEHYPSDLQSGREVALEIFGSLLSNPRYQHDLAVARAETRSALHLPALP